jgi:23S rRNA pseudouridine955/2504/2580 synthase
MSWEIVVPETEEPKRLENFLKKRFHVGYVRKLFWKNGIRLNGERCEAEAIARPGDRLELFIPFEKPPRPAEAKAAPRSPFDVVFEDADLLVIDKPAGLSVQESDATLRRHTLEGMLQVAYRPKGIVPRLAHRIDKETSGLVVVAKRPQVADELERQFETRAVEKEYLVLVVGRLFPKQGAIDFPLPGRDGRLVSARTLYRVEKEFSETTLARVKTETGRMHQIRLHFAKFQHPVVADRQHGDFAFNKRFNRRYHLRRQFLHAATIAFEYKGKKRKWTAPLPEDLARTLKALEVS